MPKIRGIKPEFWTDDVMVELSPLARLLFIGLWNFACDNGHVEDKPRQIKMRILPADDCSAKTLLDELEEVGRIARDGDYIVVPRFDKHQRIDRRYFTTCGKPGCGRPGENDATSQPESRGAHVGDTTGARRGHATSPARPHVDGDGEGESDGESEGDGDRSAIAIPDAPRPDVEAICEHLADRIEANGAKRPNVTAKWRDAARLMLDRDGRTAEEIHGCIDWCQADEFWRGNILSLPKLRDKYDQLKLQAQRKNFGTRRGDIDWDAAAARAAARDAAVEHRRGIA